MKKSGIFFIVLTLLAVSAMAGPLDDLLRGVRSPASRAGGVVTDEATAIAGLKEALSIGTGNAVASVSRIDGYFANELIKILLPDNVRTAADILGRIGFQDRVDAFVLSMNRAAENAAPKARKYFLDAIKEMTFEDARGILTGGETSATEYFKSKTHWKLYNEFRPSISESMNNVGVTRSYKEMTGTYTRVIPFAGVESLDLDHYVTTKALDGLFYMLGQEEKKIRTDPAARVTELLRRVFGRK